MLFVMIKVLFVGLMGLLTPGPDFFYVTRQALANSRRNSICGILGIAIGVFFWASLTMLGLAVLLSQYPNLIGYIMIAGGSYLCYIGYKMLKSKENVSFAEILNEQHINENTTILKEIIKGLLINLSNPKVVIFFSSILSMVLIKFNAQENAFLFSFSLGLEAFIYFYLVSLIFSRKVARRFYSKYSRYIDNLAGLVFLIFSLLLYYEAAQIFTSI